MKKAYNISGQIFNRLTAIEDTGERKGGGAVWLCKCECGNKTKVVVGNLKNNHTKSCGCLNIEKLKKAKTHGLLCNLKGKSRPLDYRLWCNIKNRCRNKNYHRYKDYGGRGIKICDKWVDSFIVFAKYIRTLENCPPEKYLRSRSRVKKSLTIDRIDNNGNYEPGNLRWATNIEQANNTRANLMVVYKNEKMSFAEAVDRFSVVAYETAKRRYKNLGWSIEDALLLPVRVKPKNKLNKAERV